MQVRGMNWIAPTQDRGKWRAVVDMVTNLWVPYNAGNFLIVDEMLVSQEGCCSTHTMLVS
jgi:hypothetical protein